MSIIQRNRMYLAQWYGVYVYGLYGVQPRCVCQHTSQAGTYVPIQTSHLVCRKDGHLNVGRVVPLYGGRVVPLCVGRVVPLCVGRVVPLYGGRVVTLCVGRMVPLCVGRMVPLCVGRVVTLM